MFCTRDELPIDRSVRRESFGVQDKAGREIGARVTLCSVVYSPSETGCWRREPGLVFAFYPKATRAGEGFGACQSAREFATIEERDAAVEAYFAGARARAEKAARSAGKVGT